MSLTEPRDYCCKTKEIPDLQTINRMARCGLGKRAYERTLPSTPWTICLCRMLRLPTAYGSRLQTLTLGTDQCQRMQTAFISRSSGSHATPAAITSWPSG